MIRVTFDGSCTPVNPGGTARIGAVVQIPDREAVEICGQIGKGPAMSNNVAEYGALIAALEYLQGEGLEREPMEIFGDSELVVEQMAGRKKIRGGLYFGYALKCQRLFERFTGAKIFWIPREQNKRADELSRRGGPYRPQRSAIFPSRNERRPKTWAAIRGAEKLDKEYRGTVG